MKKRLLSIILTAFLVLSMVPYAAFADSSIVCPACGGSVTKQERRLLTAHDDFFKCDKCGKWAWANKLGSLNLFSVGDQQILEAADSSGLLNFSFNNGHLISAEKAPSGIGRKDLPGYADDKGSALVNKDGYPSSLYVMDIGGYDSYYGYSLAYKCKYKAGLSTWRTADNLCTQFTNGSTTFSSGNAFSSSYLNNNVNKTPVLYIYYYFKPTFSGYYTFSVPTFSVTTDSKNEKNEHQNFNGTYIAKVYFGLSYNEDVFNTDGMKSLFYSDKQDYSKSFSCANYTTYLTSNQFVFIRFSAEFYGDYSSLSQSVPYRALSLKTSAPSVSAQNVEASYQNNNNITINNDTWNGNIYTDNSTNLTYIYPQYTTINEKNETVTNISNNPIIYNNETKQYYTYDSVTNNYYYITYETTPTPTPSPSPVPAPTWTPGGGATRGGGVGRHPSDTDAADWTLHYYILNNRRYDAYYALKKTEVNTETKLPWVDNKKYISTTQIPIANGQYTVSVPDGVYWRVWQWDEASKTLTGVNSSNWHGNNFTFLFNTTDEYIFEFCKSDGSEFSSPKDVVLKLKNEKITEYEPGDTIVDDTIHPETQNLIIPKMNSNTFTDEHGTWIASGSSKYSDVFDFFYAFDRSTANFWETNVSPSHLQIEIPDPENYYIDGYIMRISKFTNRYAKEWTLQGSDDGKTWDDLDTQKDQNLSDMQEHKYTLTLRKAYKYYRLNMSNYASSMCSLSHFNLLGYQTKDVVIPSPTPAPTNPPTPTTPPTPGGDNPGGSGSGSGSGDNSWNPFKWLTDLLKDLIEDILKGLWKLLTSIFGFILWLLSLLFKLFPWMSNSGILALCAGVVVVTVIRIIKFITGR